MQVSFEDLDEGEVSRIEGNPWRKNVNYNGQMFALYWVCQRDSRSDGFQSDQAKQNLRR